MSKIIAVVGASGAQGGSVVNAFLSTGEWKVRGVTRNAKSEKAEALRARGVEIVTADLDDEKALVKAFEGVTAIFGVTDYVALFATIGPKTALNAEYKQGVNLANAALQTPTLKHYIWSTLPNSSKISGGKHVVPQFDSKAEVDNYIKSKPELLAKTTFLWVGSYSGRNLFGPPFSPHHLKSIDTYLCIRPVSASTLLPLAGEVSVNIGVFVKAIVSNPSKTLGKYVICKTEVMTNGDYIQLWGKVTGKRTQYLEVSFEEYDKLFPTWGVVVAELLQFFAYAGDKLWSGGPEYLTAADLGVEGELVGTEKAFATTDWSSFD